MVAFFLLAIPFALFSIGYVGAERLWYRRAWDHRPFGPRTAWRASWGYLRRYFALGVFGGALIFLFELPAILTSHGHIVDDAGYLVSSALALLFLDFIATFMTPALAYTTRSADKAIRTGLRLVWRTLPASAPYVFVPPLALLLGTRIVSTENNVAAIVAFGVAATLLNLLVKGATARFYLRVAPSADAGAEPV